MFNTQDPKLPHLMSGIINKKKAFIPFTSRHSPSPYTLRSTHVSCSLMMRTIAHVSLQQLACHGERVRTSSQPRQ